MKQKTKVALTAFASGSLYSMVATLTINIQDLVTSTVVLTAFLCSIIFLVEAYSDD